VDEIRDQVKEVLFASDGWNKAAIDGFDKMDSLFREVGRFFNPGISESVYVITMKFLLIPSEKLL